MIIVRPKKGIMARPPEEAVERQVSFIENACDFYLLATYERPRRPRN